MSTAHPYSGTQDPRRFRRSLVDQHVLLPGQKDTPAPFELSELTSIVDGTGADGGYGTFRSVFAEGTYGEKPVAGLKIFKPVQEIAGSEVAQKVCEEEYAILCELSGEGGHAPMPYMLGTYDMAHSTNPYDGGVEYPAILMEHLDAKEVLVNQVKSGNLFGGHAGAAPTPEITLDAAFEIARALRSCHTKPLSDGREGIVHRDVSPRNVFVKMSKDGTEVDLAILIDFGQSTRLEARVSTRGRPGTVAFAAPEMNEDAKTVVCPDGETLYSKRNAPTVDIYSLGAIMYYIRTGGKIPYQGRLSGNRFADELSIKRDFPLGTLDVVEPVSSLDTALDDLIRRCTRFFPDERPQSVDEVMDEIIDLLDTEERNASVPIGVATPPPRKAVPPTPPPRSMGASSVNAAMREFADEFQISLNEAYELMAKMGYDASDYGDFLRHVKWRMATSLISKELTLDYDSVWELLPTDRDIPVGGYEDELAKWLGVFEGLGTKGKPVYEEKPENTGTPPYPGKQGVEEGLKTYTVLYTDGAGGEVFPDVEYTVAAGAKTPIFHPDSLERDGFAPRGWSRDIAETVQGDVVYTMRWIGEQASEVGEKVKGKLDATWKKSAPQVVVLIGALGSIVLSVANLAMGGGLLP